MADSKFWNTYVDHKFPGRYVFHPQCFTLILTSVYQTPSVSVDTLAFIAYVNGIGSCQAVTVSRYRCIVTFVKMKRHRIDECLQHELHKELTGLARLSTNLHNHNNPLKAATTLPVGNCALADVVVHSLNNPFMECVIANTQNFDYLRARIAEDLNNIPTMVCAMLIHIQHGEREEDTNQFHLHSNPRCRIHTLQHRCLEEKSMKGSLRPELAREPGTQVLDVVKSEGVVVTVDGKAITYVGPLRAVHVHLMRPQVEPLYLSPTSN